MEKFAIISRKPRKDLEYNMIQEQELTKAIHTYIHTYTQRRRKEEKKRSDRKNIVIYDLDKYEVLETVARRNNSNVSSILNNLYEGFLKTVASPQKTIDSYEIELKVPSISASTTTWKEFFKTLNMDDYKKFDQQLMTVFNLHNKRWEELR